MQCKHGQFSTVRNDRNERSFRLGSEGDDFCHFLSVKFAHFRTRVLLLSSDNLLTMYLDENLVSNGHKTSNLPFL